MPARNVLILDDDQAICKTLEYALDLEGFSVKTTDDGAEALRLIVKEHFDAVLIDLMMPKMHGKEFLRELLALPRSHQPAKVVISGAYTPETADLTEELGVADFIKKPFRIEDVIARVNSAIEARATKSRKA
ncbi:MAG: response regulator [Planctomycetes bacterium]|nr:response regulator [Planctomycetota bacterium]